MSNRTGEVLAHVGSAGYFDETRLGAIDMTTAIRSPGSALKPFIYGLAFEDGLAHPETLIEDRPVRFDSYAPVNFDNVFHGTVTVQDRAATLAQHPRREGAERGQPGEARGAFPRCRHAVRRAAQPDRGAGRRGPHALKI